MRFSKLIAFVFALSAAVPATLQTATGADRGYIYYAADAGYMLAQGGGSSSTVTAGVGYRFNRYFGIEGGYTGIFVDSVSASGGYIDTYGYLQLGSHSSLSLFGTAGASYIAAAYMGGRGYSASAFGLRGGGGIECRLTESWTLRTAVRYQSTLTKAAVVSLGVTLHF